MRPGINITLFCWLLPQPANIVFLSHQTSTSHQTANSIFLSQQISTSHQSTFDICNDIELRDLYLPLQIKNILCCHVGLKLSFSRLVMGDKQWLPMFTARMNCCYEYRTIIPVTKTATNHLG